MTEINNILLIGRSGRGKSTLANVLSETSVFEESSGSASKTKKIKSKLFEDKENNTNYLIIDTPGIGDTKMSDNEVLDIIAETVYLVRDGVSQVLFVIDGRFDQSEMATYNLLRTVIFDQDIAKHTTITRTRFGEFLKKKKCKDDIDLMIEESKGKKIELEKKIADKEEEKKQLEEKKITHDSEQYQKLLEEIKQLKKELTTNLTEIIESCKEKIIYVDNPSIDIRDEGGLKDNKTKRKMSRKVVMKHLKKTCKGEVYKPEKLKELSSKISDYMEQKKEAEKELEKKRKKLNLEKDMKTKDGEVIHKDDLPEDAESDKNKLSFQLKALMDSVATELKDFLDIWKSKKKKDEGEHFFKFFKKRIVKLRKRIKKLEKVKRLEEEIAKKEKTIQREVSKHIFNNYDEIVKIDGGDKFISEIFGDELDFSEMKMKDDSKIEELVSQWEALKEKKNKKDKLTTSLSIEDEIKWREEELIKWNKYLLNIEEISKEWKKQNFDIEKAQEWAEVLGNSFDPETDFAFCAWLRDNEESTIKEIIDDIKKGSNCPHNIKILREEYEKNHDDWSLQKWLDEEYQTAESKKKVREIVIGWRDEFHSNLSLTEGQVKGLSGGELDLSEYPNLKKIWIWGDYLRTPLTKLELGEKPKLTELVCARNQLNILDLTNCPNLNNIQCWKNQLVELKLDDLEKLTRIGCSNNKLNDLDLTGLNRLKEVNCSWNELEKLILPKKLDNLEELTYRDNCFSEEDLEKLEEISGLIEAKTKDGIFTGTLKNLPGQISDFSSQIRERFKGEIPKEWRDEGFDYEEYKKWNKISSLVSSLVKENEITNYPEFVAWLEHSEGVTPELVLIRSKIKVLRNSLQEEYQEYSSQKEQESQIQIPPK